MPDRDLFPSLAAARRIIEAWRTDYNTIRPHSCLGGMAPAEFTNRPRQGYMDIEPNLPVRGLSASDDATILKCLATLKRTHADTGFIHEVFEKDEPAKFTRDWFAWANGLFGEFVLHLAATKPRLLQAPLDQVRV